MDETETKESHFDEGTENTRWGRKSFKQQTKGDVMKIEAFTEIKSMWQVRRVVLINGDCWLVDKLITSAGADDGDGDIDSDGDYYNGYDDHDDHDDQDDQDDG